MIDSQSEQIITFTQAADELPRRRRGRKTHVSTLFRWSTTGCRGVVLETIQVGGTRCTSREALQRFFERLCEARQAAPDVSQPLSGPLSGRRSAANRQRRWSAAGEELGEPTASREPPRQKCRASWVRFLNSNWFRAIATGLGATSAILRLASIAVERLWRHCLRDFRLQTSERPVLTDAAKEVTSSDSARCTPGCTGEVVSDVELNDDALADFVASLTPERRRHLAELLTSAEQNRP
jgi:hypothetical protein